MRLEDAPRPGWYPDPEGSSRLRWWEGTDWSDRYRPRPSTTLPPMPAGSTAGPSTGAPTGHPVGAWPGAAPSLDPQQLVEQVRLAARQEAERAAQTFGRQARAVTREIEPLVSRYTSTVTTWLRRGAVVVVVVLVAWVVWQVAAQASLLDWVGDRIDDLDTGGR